MNHCFSRANCLCAFAHKAVFVTYLFNQIRARVFGIIKLRRTCGAKRAIGLRERAGKENMDQLCTSKQFAV